MTNYPIYPTRQFGKYQTVYVRQVDDGYQEKYLCRTDDLLTNLSLFSGVDGVVPQQAVPAWQKIKEMSEMV